MISHLYWLTQTLADVPEGESWLSDGERRILSGLRFDKRRKDWLLGRWTAKRALCAAQALESPILSTIEIRAAADGAPEAFRDGEPADVAISISHSNARSFCAVGPPRVSMGCDLELMEARDDKLIEDYFTSEEKALCAADPLENSLCANLIWSAKESMLKALREGLRRDTRSVVVHPDFQSDSEIWKKWTGRCMESSRTFYGWWRCRDGFIYTLASDTFLEPSGF